MTTNIFKAAAIKQAQFTGMLNDMGGYETFTTFYYDLTIAELCGGAAAIKDTHRRVCNEWIEDYKYLTEYIMALNHKIWEHYEKNPILSQCYNKLWIKAERLFHSVYAKNDEALQYYYRVTD